MKQKELCRLHINGYDDRTKLVVILADNGYPVKIDEVVLPGTISSNYWVVIYDKD